MAEIVSGLFGIDPNMLQQQQQAAASQRAFNYANLGGAEQGQYSMFTGGQQAGQAVQGLLGMQDPMMQKASMAKQLASQFDITTADGLRQYAQALAQNGAPDLAQLATTEADKREASGLELRKTKAQAEKIELSTAQEEKLRQELSTLGPNPSEQQIISVVSKYGSPDKILAVLTASQDRKAARDVAAANRAASQGPMGPLTPAEKVVDQKFGKEYNDFVNGGGINTVEKNLKMLDDAIKIIQDSPDGDTTGKMVGLADKAGTLSYTHPKAAEAKDLIGGVAQSNLRQVLGGQFAAKEGEQLLARAYNPAQPKKDNLNRLNALREQIANTGTAKTNAAMYYQENGTLKGFKGVGAVVEKPATDNKEKKTRTLKSGKVVTIED